MSRRRLLFFPICVMGELNYIYIYFYKKTSSCIASRSVFIAVYQFYLPDASRQNWGVGYLTRTMFEWGSALHTPVWVL